MCMQEMSTAIQYDLPVKIFILNNEYMGMVRQWQELLHGKRYSPQLFRSLARFRQAGGSLRLRRPARHQPGELDAKIQEMICGQQAGAVRLPRRSGRQLLPHDPVGRGAQRDDPGRPGRRRRVAKPARCWSEMHDTKVKLSDEIERHTLTVLVDNEAGVLARVVGLFSGRGYNIESLTVAEVDPTARTSRITIVTSRHARGDRADRGAAAPPGDGPPRHQLDRRRRPASSARWRWSRCRAPAKSGSRRCAWPTPSAPAPSTPRIPASCSRSPARPAKIDSFIELMRPLGLVDVSRTGVAAISRGPEAM